jgi:hypothetical protein
MPWYAVLMADTCVSMPHIAYREEQEMRVGSLPPIETIIGELIQVLGTLTDQVESKRAW